MATISGRTLFFTTSPRTPVKMIPEITLLAESFSGLPWNKITQERFMEELSQSDFFEGTGSSADLAFSARDRINRAPKALGFVNLSPTIHLTAAGNQYVYGNRAEEIFTRQLLKFQLPSPYHKESRAARIFWVKPYLEIFRLIYDLESLAFDELMIYGMQLTDYRNYDSIKEKIIEFRRVKAENRGNYRSFYRETVFKELKTVYQHDIKSGQIKTRESAEKSINKFIETKKGNLRDYTDACVRYLRATGLISISHQGHTLRIPEEKKQEVEFFLNTVERSPCFIENIDEYKEYLFNPEIPKLLSDDANRIVENLLNLSTLTPQELSCKSVEQLKDLRDQLTAQKREAIIEAQIVSLKTYSLFSEVIETFNSIIAKKLYDLPLMLEWNTWRAMTMLNGGTIKGYFKVDDFGEPMSTALGNVPDIECDYDEFHLTVEVTLQQGQRQYESEGESIARHLGQVKKRTGKESYCLFITPKLNRAALAHIFVLNQTDISYYGGKSKIIPLDLGVFIQMLYGSIKYGHPSPSHVKSFCDRAIGYVAESQNEEEWLAKVNQLAENWVAQV